MARYEQDLRDRNREAIIARYDPQGVFLLGDGSKAFWSRDSVASFYRSHWSGPEFFEFVNMTYDSLGPEALGVIGQFRWKAADQPDTSLFSYTAILIRRDGRLYLRIENESTGPGAP